MWNKKIKCLELNLNYVNRNWEEPQLRDLLWSHTGMKEWVHLNILNSDVKLLLFEIVTTFSEPKIGIHSMMMTFLNFWIYNYEVCFSKLSYIRTVLQKIVCLPSSIYHTKPTSRCSHETSHAGFVTVNKYSFTDHQISTLDEIFF